MLPGNNITLTAHEFELFRELVYEETGISLRDQKRLLLNNRLLKRLRHYGFGCFMEYYEYVRCGGGMGGEIQELINAVTTNKTEFFRESHHFDMLAELLLSPAAHATALGSRPRLRIWSAGCSTGEEPYSIAITIAMHLERLAAWDIKILASDIDTSVLERARAAIYSREAVRGLPHDILKKHLLSGTGEHADSVQIKPEIRNLVEFAHINLMKEPWPFHGKLDAIFCRNVIIYFDQETQRRLVESFARWLKPGGLFFAGHSENLFWLGDLLEPIGQTVYRMRGTSPDALRTPPVTMWPAPNSRGRS
jgi:chemotaxis protein methyltransferase CheR